MTHGPTGTDWELLLLVVLLLVLGCAYGIYLGARAWRPQAKQYQQLQAER